MPSPQQFPRILASFLVFVLPQVLAGCREKPQEVATPAATAQSAPVVPPVEVEFPGTWIKLGQSQVDNKRAGYKVPKAGADTEDAELIVLFFGTGSQGDPDKNFNDWLSQFDGNAAAGATRSSFESAAGKVDTVEFFGTYKVGLGPAVGPKKKSPMQMVKDKWRLYAAVIHTKDRGNWFYKMVGPDETVQSAKGAMETALKAAK
ncbi:MAG: hypothetical protein IPK82_00675 [Polyangiaceae bacterium]|nr:hypothetical protein [Polyangiaceae bacterium]